MKPTLLIAENDPALVELYRQHFVENGFRVLTASDGTACLAIIRSESPAVLVVALEMPWGAGRGVMDGLRLEARKRPIPSVILTGFAPQEHVADWTDPFFVRYFNKPVAMPELLQCVRSAQTQPHDWRRLRVGQSLD